MTRKSRGKAPACLLAQVAVWMFPPSDLTQPALTDFWYLFLGRLLQGLTGYTAGPGHDYQENLVNQACR